MVGRGSDRRARRNGGLRVVVAEPARRRAAVLLCEPHLQRRPRLSERHLREGGGGRHRRRDGRAGRRCGGTMGSAGTGGATATGGTGGSIGGGRRWHRQAVDARRDSRQRRCRRGRCDGRQRRRNRRGHRGRRAAQRGGRPAVRRARPPARRAGARRHSGYALCGNGVLDPGEGCDDHNRTPATAAAPSARLFLIGCARPSVLPACCARFAATACSRRARPVTTPTRGSGDGCSADCKTVEAGYECRVPGRACVPLCGDGMKIAGESCDDGNT